MMLFHVYIWLLDSTKTFLHKLKIPLRIFAIEP